MKYYQINREHAIRIAERDNLNLLVVPFNDFPVVELEAAREIIQNPSTLFYILVRPDGWWDGSRVVAEMPGYNVSDYFAPDGMYLGPDEDGIEPRWSDA